MKTKIKVILITVLTLILLVLGLAFAINHKNKSIRYFSNSGYIIGNIYENSGEIETVYFNNDSKYKKHSDNEFKITDVDGNKIIIDEEMFVHYTDESIMALKKGVAIDLNKIDSKLLKYYNIFSGATLQKTNEGYEIKNIDDIIGFNKLMFKISDKKYLIAADEIIAYFSDTQTINFKNFVEIEYVNENVIKIYNNESNYQSISSKLYLIIDDIKIDLGYKTIEKNNKEYLTMANLNINSNDNIEILPEKEEQEEEQENNPNNNGGNNVGNSGGGNSTNNQGNGQQNNIDTSILDGLIPSDPNETIKEESIVHPKFTVENLDVTMIGFENLNITMVDEAGILYGNSEVKIIENSTGKEFILDEWLDGNSNYIVNAYSGLDPDAEYTLTVTGKYEIDDTIYDRIYVSKIFRTLDIGVEVLGDCATSDSLSFAIYKSDYANVSSITYDILDHTGKVIEQDKKLKYEDKDYVIAKVDGLVSNAKYKLVIKYIQYGTDNVPIQKKYSMKTLKQRPDLTAELIADVNNLKNQLILNVENISDINKGIKSYTYKIYIDDGMSFDEKEPLYVVTKDDSSETTIDIANHLINGGRYYFNVELEFEDNEKTIIFDTQYSNVVSTSDKVYPQVVEYISGDYVNCQELKGVLNIKDEENFIKSNNIYEYKVSLRERGNSLSTNIYDDFITVNGTLEDGYQVPVHFENLKPNTEYILYTSLIKNNETIYIGYVTAKTTETDALYLNMEDIDTEESVDSELFKFSMTLSESDEFDAQMYEFIRTNLNYITLQLFGCDGNNCAPLQFEKSISNSNDSQQLVELLEKETLFLNSSDFGFSSSDYKGYDSYKLYVKAYSKFNYEIPIYINDEKTNYYTLTIIDNIPTVDVHVSQILNMQSLEYDNTLESTTVVGYKLNIKEISSTKGLGIHEFKYKIYKYDGDCATIDEQSLEAELIRENSIALDEINLKDHYVDIYMENTMHRGEEYCLVYNSNYYIDESREKTETTYYEGISMLSNKQTAKILGTLIKYQKNNITFKLDLDDIDSSVSELYLKNSSGQKSSLIIPKGCNAKGKFCEYSFEISPLTDLTKLGLYIKVQKNEKAGIEDRLVYEFALDEIKSLSKTEPINLNVKSKNSRLAFYLNDLGVDVFGLKITSGNKEKFISLSKKKNTDLESDMTGIENDTLNSDLYVAEIRNQDLEQYGITVNGYDISLEGVDIELIYSDGSIDLMSSSFVSLKQANNSLASNLYYYNNYPANYVIQELFEKSTSLSSIYYKEPLKSFANNKLITLKNLEYVSSDKDNNTIGQSILSELVHLYKIDFKELELSQRELKIDTILSTKNTVTYTTTGASIDFEIQDSNILGTLVNVGFELNCDGQEESVQWENKDGLISAKNTTTHLETVDKNDKMIMSVNLKDIKDYNKCQYTLKYTKETDDGKKELISINTVSNQPNENVEITSLKELSFTNWSVIYSHTKWHLNEKNDDLIFNKNLEYSFRIYKDYKLNANEKLYYDVYIVNESNESIKLLEEQLIETQNISEVIDLYSNIGAGKPIVAGLYELRIKPFVKTDENEIYELDSFDLPEKFEVKTQKPDVNILAYQDVIHLSVLDSDGIFSSWNANDKYSSANLENIIVNKKDIIYNNKKYYFELLSGENVVAYKPLSFTTETQQIILTELFGTTLQNGIYNARICYYSVLTNGKECTQPKEVMIMNSNSLNATIIGLSKSYLLYFDKPDEMVKDEIGRISYTMKYDDDYITMEIEKIEYRLVEMSDGSVSYVMELPIAYGITSQIEQIEVKILNKSGIEMTTIFYE